MGLAFEAFRLQPPDRPQGRFDTTVSALGFQLALVCASPLA